MSLHLHEIAFLPLEDAETAILATLPEGYDLTFAMDAGQWVARFHDNSGTVLWSGYGPDRRILLFDAYGWFLQQRGDKPRHPAWAPRSGEIVVAPRHGAKAHQSHTPIPDPEDLDPSEILAVYGIKPRKKDAIK
jgi:hypothetical protein